MIIGLDIGGTKCAVILLTIDGKIIERTQFPTGDTHPDSLIPRLLDAAKKLIDNNNVNGVAVSIGGPLDPTTGIVKGPPNLPGWDYVPLREQLETALNLPVVVEHDAKACALAEWLYGAGRGMENLAYLTLGTGLGAGLIINGRLYRGYTGLAGELGHWRLFEDGPEGYGVVGSFEGSCCGPGLSRIHGGGDPKEIAEAARRGDQRALNSINIFAQRLGHGIALLADLLNLQAVVLGSLGTRLADLILDTVIDTVLQETLPEIGENIEILPSALKDSVQDLAPLAAWVYCSEFGSESQRKN